MTDGLYQITAPHMCCGFDVINGAVRNPAPIIRWMQGKTIGFVSQYCQRKHWSLVKVEDA